MTDGSTGNEQAVLECRNVMRHFREGASTLEVLRGVNLEVRPAERVAIIGASGSGKTTLLQIMAVLDDPDDGEVLVNGQSMHGSDEAAKGDLRNRYIGFVYQFHHLRPEFTAEENVAMPLLIRREHKAEALQQARGILGRVGLGERLSHKPGELSGGERQRAAVARALITRPRLVLADEPTGNLDPVLSREIMQIFVDFNQVGVTVLVASHDLGLIEELQKPVVTLNRGQVIHNDLEVADD